MHAKLPVVLVNVPATHCLHCEAEERPIELEKEPTGHRLVQLVLPAASW